MANIRYKDDGYRDAAPLYVQATVDTTDETTDGLEPRLGEFHVSIDCDGSWSGTVTLQTQASGSSDWVNVETYTETTFKTGRHFETGRLWRLYATTVSAGEAVCRISQ